MCGFHFGLSDPTTSKVVQSTPLKSVAVGPHSGRLQQAGRHAVTVVQTNEDTPEVRMVTFCNEIRSHYSTIWANAPVVKKWEKGPVADLPPGFCVLEFAPTDVRRMWTYATCCMSKPSDLKPIELHLFSPVQSELQVELLTVVAHFHRTGELLGLGHTINFGRPWLDGSVCDYGLISLPYLDGPMIEEFRPPSGHAVRCLWLVPITKAERDYKTTHGLEALERKFEQAKFDYLDPFRSSVVQT